MAIFQFAFGLVVFAITRQVYAPDPNIVSHMQTAPGQPSLDWIDRIPETSPALFDPVISNQSTIRDPEELSRQANVYFANQQYAMQYPD